MRKTPLTVLLAITGVFTGVGTAAYFLHDTNDQLWSLAATAAQPSTFQPSTDPAKAAAQEAGTTRPALPDRIESAVFAQVANAYQTTSRHPEYSAPMNQAQMNGYLSNNHNPVTLDVGDTTLALSLNQYRFTEGQTLEALLAKSGPAITPTKLSGTAALITEDTGESVSFSEIEPGAYEGTLSTEGMDPGEYDLRVTVPLDGSPITHVARFHIEPHLMDLLEADRPSVSDNHLVMPVDVDVHQSGDYEIAASLSVDGRAVGMVRETTTLSKGKRTIRLRAHGTLLADYPDMERLTLDQFRIRRLPPRPGDTTEFAYPDGTLNMDAPTGASSLMDEPLKNPQVVQRMEFLQRLQQQ